METDKWNVTSPAGFSVDSRLSPDLPDRAPALPNPPSNLEDVLEDFANQINKNRTGANDTTSVVMSQNPITAAISKITSAHCGSFLCIPHVPNDLVKRPKVSVII